MLSNCLYPKELPRKTCKSFVCYQRKRSWKDPWMGCKHLAAQIPRADTRCPHQLLLKGMKTTQVLHTIKTPITTALLNQLSQAKRVLQKPLRFPITMSFLSSTHKLYWITVIELTGTAQQQPKTADIWAVSKCETVAHIDLCSLEVLAPSTMHSKIGPQRSLTPRESFPLILD